MRDKHAVVITPYRDGPLIIRGPVQIVSETQEPIAAHNHPIALCRCGKSRTKPFCDGTHKLTQFRA